MSATLTIVNYSGERRAERLSFRIEAHAAAEVFAASASDWFWLDGSGAPTGEARVSYLGVATEVLTSAAGGEQQLLDQIGDGEPGHSSTRGFHGGWVVALGYEFGVSLMGIDPPPDTAPAAFAMRADAVLAVDHDTGTAEVRGAAEKVADFLRKYGDQLTHSFVQSELSAHSDDFGQIQPNDVPLPNEATDSAKNAERNHSMVDQPQWRRDDATYRLEVERCRAAIHDGDAYVLCLTDTAQARGAWDPLTVYLRMRAAGAAERGGVLVAGDRALVSASPERFLSRDREQLATHPIKGTRRRGATGVEDAELAAQLQRDPKERAENLMIVDLMRNDLSRVCEPETVRVDGFLRVETHTHVHQLVSTVSGKLRPKVGTGEILRACFPGGSMTGAPKRSAVHILAELEEHPRGLYSGCFGWIGDDGDLELGMSIRCIELRSSASRFDTALVGAGGGITADSDPDFEVAEKRLKATAVIAAMPF